MVSSLAAQLASGASLNAAFLTERGRRGPTKSYLFAPGAAADAHNLPALRELGASALAQLSLRDPRFSGFEESLFSDRAGGTDRTLLSHDAAAALSSDIEAFLVLLGPWIMEPAAGRALEWLVRRFRVHEFDAEPVLRAFMPYHEGPHFAKMLSLLSIPCVLRIFSRDVAS
jgi:U3 small nucleolar RNA-associated protein 10